uniref:Uncharacterized protein n=1 Tax=viral metagenome TaxID=1070528 RepID=A0A6C0B5U9_9ZZZZ
MAYGVAYGKDNLGSGLWVAVGDGTKIATSPDGNIWTDVPAASLGGIGTGRGIAYGNGRWVAVSPGPKIVTSITGKNWAATAPYGTLGSNAYSVAYGNGEWVVVGNGGGIPIVKSPSGTAWSDATTISYAVNTLYGVAYGNGRWVALGDTGGNNKIYSSITNGDTWAQSANPGSFTGYNGLGVAYGNGLWVAVGDIMSLCMVTSNNGTNWNAVPVISLGGLTSGYGVAFKNEIL